MIKPLPDIAKAFASIVLLIVSTMLSTTVFAQPANDNCAGAVLLNSGTTCNNTAGTVANATNSGIAVGTCTGSPNDDVWYRFVASSANQSISLSNIGANLNTSGPRLQLFSGPCGSLSPIACGTTNIIANNLTPGTTYYVRVYSAGIPTLTSNAGFNICVKYVTIDFGKSYVNISKPNSGTVENGDTLEIRASVVVRAGAADSCRYKDNVPAGTTYIPGSLCILTNEGKVFRQFTDMQYDAVNDPGWITGTNITMNLGYNITDVPATISGRGRIANNHKPSFGGNNCIMMATYRVVVTTAIGGFINTGGGSIEYSLLTPNISTFTFPSNTVAVYKNFGMCANAIGTNSIGTEFNGSFGSGPTRNRGASANVPTGYTYSTFTNSGPNDYYYGIANNTSTVDGYTTLNTWAKPDGSSPSHRVFGLWDIIGDHTGAANPALGNTATDTVANNNGGYMLVVNAAYRIDSAFQQTISNLCPNTYYEISCWMRNICSKCGCDSNGRNATQGAGYIPTAPGDSSGVNPNITFEVDGVDYYTTGNLKYTGEWVKRGFTILTGPLQTSFTLKFFNNAPGGGGNDWALDDISVATCLPNMKYSPSINPTVCNNNALTIYDTVRSYFNNYVYYKWQRSTDAGVTWTDVTGSLGPAAPVWNGSAWEYVSSYTIPSTLTFPANSGDLYRMIVATTSTNLSNNNCRSTDPTNIVTLNVLTCGPVLSTHFLSVTGKVNNNRSTIKWISTNEEGPLFYDVEKSINGSDFTVIGTVEGYNNPGRLENSYAFIDPQDIGDKAFYRIRVRNTAGQTDYSRIVSLSGSNTSFSLMTVVNPFSEQLVFEMTSAKSTQTLVELVDQFGSIVIRGTFNVQEGTSQLALANTGNLRPGMYVLRLQQDGKVIYRKVMKQVN